MRANDLADESAGPQPDCHRPEETTQSPFSVEEDIADALAGIGSALSLGLCSTSKHMPAAEHAGHSIKIGLSLVADALNNVATAIREHADDELRRG